MSKVTCSVCHATLDSRSMSACSDCNSYMCSSCGALHGDHCPTCADEDEERR